MTSKKPLKEFNREAHENDSRGVKRDQGVVIKGTQKPVTVSREAFNQSIYMGRHYNDMGHGGMRFQSDNLTVTIQDGGDSLCLHTVAKRGEEPVIAGFEFEKNGDDLVLKRGYVQHKNQSLDDQHVNSPQMLRFSLEAVYKEVRRVMQPAWLSAMAGAYFYDQDNGTSTQAEFLPSIAIREGKDGQVDEITFVEPINTQDYTPSIGHLAEPQKPAFSGH